MTAAGVPAGGIDPIGSEIGPDIEPASEETGTGRIAGSAPSSVDPEIGRADIGQADIGQAGVQRVGGRLAGGGSVFQRLGPGRRIWAVASIHGDVDRLANLHDALIPRMSPGDRIVYLGNVIGRGPDPAATLDELIHFRRAFLAQPGMCLPDIAFLRGSQEEMWHKLLQLQLAPNPGEVLEWMLSEGIRPTIEAYGGHVEDGQAACRGGARAITRWTDDLRRRQALRPGHEVWRGSLRRAAYSHGGELLFVNAGLDTSRPLSTQSDSFWWSSGGFHELSESYGGFMRVIRGFAPQPEGVLEGAFTLGLDKGSGRGGTLVAACLTTSGDIDDLIES